MKTTSLTKILRMKILTALAAGTVGIFSLTPAVYALPKLDSIVTSGVTISTPNVSNMNIGSTATNNVLKWKDFSIDSGETVVFDSKNYVNLVTGSNMSGIWGTLKGGGDIYLINPHGVLFGAGSTVDVGSLYVSTASITGNDFDTLKTNALSTSSSYTGDIINMGTLKAAHNITLAGNNLIFDSKADDSGIANLTAGASDKVKLLVGTNGMVQVGGIVYDDGTAQVTPQDTTHTSGRMSANTEFQLVRNSTELQNINNDLNSNYMLAGDLDMDGVSNYTPIGTYDDSDRYHPVENGFKGRFNGLNYAIKDLSISLTEAKLGGLFGVTEAGSIVENVGRVGGVTTGEKVEFMGSIVGRCHGKIHNVYNTGNVTITTTDPYDAGVGGIAGALFGDGGEIVNAYNTGDVITPFRCQAGGILGASANLFYPSNTNPITIKNVYNTGKVKGYYVGGILGLVRNGDTLENVFNTGEILDVGNYGAYSGNIWGRQSGSANFTEASDLQSLQAIIPTVATPYKATISKSTYDGSKPAGTVGTINGVNYGVHTVEKKLLTLDATGVRGQDGTIQDVDLNTVELALEGAIANDDVSPDFTNRDVADNTLTYTGLQLAGEDADNYKLGAGTLIISKAVYDGTKTVGTTLTADTTDKRKFTLDLVVPKVLTLTAADITKQEDGTPNVDMGNVHLTLNGVVGSDVVTVSAESATFDSASAGARNVTYTGLRLAGANAGNYRLADTFVGAGTITAKSSPEAGPGGSSPSPSGSPLIPAGPVGGDAGGEDVPVTMRSLTEAQNAVSPNVQTTNAPILADSNDRVDMKLSFLADGLLTFINEGARPPVSMSAGEFAIQQTGVQSTAVSSELQVLESSETNEFAATDTSAAGEENSTATDAETADTANQE